MNVVRRMLDSAIAQLQAGKSANFNEAIVKAYGGPERAAEVAVNNLLARDRKNGRDELHQGQLRNGGDGGLFGLFIPPYIITDDGAKLRAEATLRDLRTHNRRARRLHERAGYEIDQAEQAEKQLLEAADGDLDVLIPEAIVMMQDQDEKEAADTAADHDDES